MANQNNFASFGNTNTENHYHITNIYGEKKEIPKFLTPLIYAHSLQFVHRERDLQNLKSLLDTKGVAQLVQGLGGIGKSALMQQFVSVFQQSYDCIIFLEIDSHFGDSEVDKTYNEDNFIASFFKDAILPTNCGFAYNPNIPDKDQIRQLLNYLQGLKGNHLMVLDNVSEAIKDYIPVLPKSPNWSVLISSREKIGTVPIYTLQPLNEPELTDLFNTYYTSGLKEIGFEVKEIEKMKNDALLHTILSDIQNHTLTTELLAKTAAVEGWSVEKLKEHIKDLDIDSTIEIDAHYMGKDTNTPLWEHIMARFAISLNDELQTMLRYFSVLPSEPILKEHLHILFSTDEYLKDNIPNILNKLTQKGWLSRKSNTWECHTIIQKVLRELLKPHFENCINLVNSTETLLFHDKIKGEHALDKKNTINIGLNVVKHFDGQYTYIAYIFTNLSLIYSALGDLPKSEMYVLKGHNILTSISDENDSNLARSFNNLSEVYKSLGNLDKALKYSLKSLEIIEKNLEKNFTDLPMVYSNLGMIYSTLGNLDLALNYMLKAHDIWNKMLGKKSLFFAITCNNLGLIYRDLGVYDKALEYTLESYSIRKKILPNNHPDLAITYNNLGLIYKDLGNLDKALKYALRDVELSEITLEQNHPSLARSYSNLAFIYEKSENLNKALEYALKAFDIRKKVLDKNHFDLAISYNNLATIYNGLKFYDKALTFSLEDVKILEKILEKDHQSLAMSYGNLGTIYENLMNINKSLNYKLKCHNILVKTLDENHPYLAISCNNLASIYYQLKQFHNAKTYIDRAVIIFQKIKHPDVLNVLQSQKVINAKIRK